ncbi:MAG: helix-turn-helix transcriptional regulator [Clostridia bacterium]|nr:helix-turn-helix transcriptional regulator [Clostridia bacterium]
MLSFGQRLKLLRKEADISQSDLADALGVSAQSISKWECDLYFPDVSMLLPLATVLGVTTDCLLGAGGNEKEDLEEYNAKYKELIEMEWFPGKDNRCYLMYKLSKDFLRKYPMNYYVKIQCADDLYYYLKWGIKDAFYEIPASEYEELWEDGVNMLLSVKKRDNDPSRQSFLRVVLIKYYSLKGKWAEAESTALELPSNMFTCTESLLDIASEKKDFEEAEKLSFKIVKELGAKYYSALWTHARRISIFGNVRKEEAISAYERSLSFACLLEKFADDFDRYEMAKYWQIDSLTSISCCNLAIDRVDRSLDCVEKVTELTIELYEATKKNYPESEHKKETLSSLKYFTLIWCYNAVIEDDDNILTREERYKACKARIDALE